MPIALQRWEYLGEATTCAIDGASDWRRDYGCTVSLCPLWYAVCRTDPSGWMKTSPMLARSV